MVKKIDHIELIVSDAEETREFLERLGMEVHRETDHHGKSYELKPTGQDRPLIEIHTAIEEEAPGLNHIAFLVDELEETTKSLEEAGVTIDEGPHTFGPTGRTKSDIRDNDGRRFQLVLDKESDDGE